MSTLSHFQSQCSAELVKLINALGYEASRLHVVNGREEAYIEADLGPVKVWIYDDGACWQGFGRDRVFEAIDYDSLADLQQAFLSEVASALSQKS